MVTFKGPQSLLKDLPESLSEETFLTLLDRPGIRVERIVSTGHRTLEGLWLVGHEDEWVLVLKGSARLRLEGEAQEVSLEEGDSFLIPAGVRHRVTYTAEDLVTVWLAIHLSPKD